MWYRMILIAIGICGVGFCQEKSEGEMSPSNPPSNTGRAAGDDRALPSIPPELIREIRALSGRPENRLVLPPLSRGHRVLVGMLSILILLGGGYICRLARDGGGPMRSGMCRMLLFSLFSGLAALCIASAFAGTLYLHVAAAGCTAGGGFCVAMLLVPQFGVSRRWIMEPEVGEGEIQ